MAKPKVSRIEGRPLRTVADTVVAVERLYNQQVNGLIDTKTADGINTTLKGAIYLNAKLKMDAAKLIMQSKIKKLQLPAGLLETFLGTNKKITEEE